MTKIRLYFPLVVMLLAYSSCGVTGPQINLYGPPKYADNIAYQPKPLSSDSSHHGTYISGSFFEGQPANDKNGSDAIAGGELNIGQGFTLPNFNVAYGGFAGFGNYHNSNNTNEITPQYFYNKSFGEVGGRFSANAFIPIGQVDVRFIGFEMAYTHEFGDYLAYRKAITGDANFFTDNRSDIVTMGGTSEVAWHSRNYPLQFGLRLFIGATLGDNRYKNPNSPYQQYDPNLSPVSIAYFMQVKKTFFIGEITPYGGQIRVGFRF
jgi:hypothetical protein